MSGAGIGAGTSGAGIGAGMSGAGRDSANRNGAGAKGLRVNGAEVSA